jgi:hypothetical protein
MHHCCSAPLTAALPPSLCCSGAQVVLRLPNPFKRARLAAQARAAAPAPPADPTAGGQGTLPDGANNPSSSSTDAGEACPPDWALAAIGASSTSSSSSNVIATNLPASTERVLVCLISSGVHTAAPALKDNRWTGCAKEDPLDPTGEDGCAAEEGHWLTQWVKQHHSGAVALRSLRSAEITM